MKQKLKKLILNSNTCSLFGQDFSTTRQTEEPFNFINNKSSHALNFKKSLKKGKHFQSNSMFTQPKFNISIIKSLEQGKSDDINQNNDDGNHGIFNIRSARNLHQNLDCKTVQVSMSARELFRLKSLHQPNIKLKQDSNDQLQQKSTIDNYFTQNFHSSFLLGIQNKNNMKRFINDVVKPPQAMDDILIPKEKIFSQTARFKYQKQHIKKVEMSEMSDICKVENIVKKQIEKQTLQIKQSPSYSCNALQSSIERTQKSLTFDTVSVMPLITPTEIMQNSPFTAKLIEYNPTLIKFQQDLAKQIRKTIHFSGLNKCSISDGRTNALQLYYWTMAQIKTSEQEQQMIQSKTCSFIKQEFKRKFVFNEIVFKEIQRQVAQDMNERGVLLEMVYGQILQCKNDVQQYYKQKTKTMIQNAKQELIGKMSALEQRVSMYKQTDNAYRQQVAQLEKQVSDTQECLKQLQKSQQQKQTENSKLKIELQRMKKQFAKQRASVKHLNQKLINCNQNNCVSPISGKNQKADLDQERIANMMGLQQGSPGKHGQDQKQKYIDPSLMKQAKKAMIKSESNDTSTLTGYSSSSTSQIQSEVLSDQEGAQEGDNKDEFQSVNSSDEDSFSKSKSSSNSKTSKNNPQQQKGTKQNDDNINDKSLDKNRKRRRGAVLAADTLNNIIVQIVPNKKKAIFQDGCSQTEIFQSADFQIQAVTQTKLSLLDVAYDDLLASNNGLLQMREYFRIKGKLDYLIDLDITNRRMTERLTNLYTSAEMERTQLQNQQLLNQINAANLDDGTGQQTNKANEESLYENKNSIKLKLKQKPQNAKEQCANKKQKIVKFEDIVHEQIHGTHDLTKVEESPSNSKFIPIPKDSITLHTVIKRRHSLDQIQIQNNKDNINLKFEDQKAPEKIQRLQKSKTIVVVPSASVSASCKLQNQEQTAINQIALMYKVEKELVVSLKQDNGLLQLKIGQRDSQLLETGNVIFGLRAKIKALEEQYTSLNRQHTGIMDDMKDYLTEKEKKKQQLLDAQRKVEQQRKQEQAARELRKKQSVIVPLNVRSRNRTKTMQPQLSTIVSTEATAPLLGVQHHSININYEHKNQQKIVSSLKRKAINKHFLAKFKNYMRVHNVLKTIHLIFQEFIKQLNDIAKRDSVKDIPMDIFAYQVILDLYGFKKVVDQKYLIFILSLRQHIKYIRVHNFCNLMGLNKLESCNYSLEEQHKYMEALLYFHNNESQGFTVPYASTDPNQYVPFIRVMHYIQHVLEVSIPPEEQNKFRNDIQKLKIHDVTNVNMHGLMDLDIFLQKLISTYRTRLNKTKLYVVNAFAASDLDGNGQCDIDEFILLNRHIEASQFNQEKVEKMFKDYADLENAEDPGNKNMSFDQFAVVSVEYNLFSDEAQNKYIGLPPTGLTPVQIKLQIHVIMNKLLVSWKTEKDVFLARFQKLTMLEPSEVEKWVEIIQVLDTRLQQISQGNKENHELKPILIAFNMVKNESQMLEDEQQEYDEDMRYDNSIDQTQQQPPKEQKDIRQEISNEKNSQQDSCQSVDSKKSSFQRRSQKKKNTSHNRQTHFENDQQNNDYENSSAQSFTSISEEQDLHGQKQIQNVKIEQFQLIEEVKEEAEQYQANNSKSNQIKSNSNKRKQLQKQQTVYF